jgi:hypothetical protein
VTQRIEPVGPRRDIAPVERALLTPVERELERERREERRRRRPSKPPAEPPREGGLDVRA